MASPNREGGSVAFFGAANQLLSGSRVIGDDDASETDRRKSQAVRMRLTSTDGEEMAESIAIDDPTLEQSRLAPESNETPHGDELDGDQYGDHALHGQGRSSLSELSIAKRLRVAARAATMTSALALTVRSSLKGENCTYNLKESSLFILGPNNWLRRQLFLIVDNKWFERAVLFIIFLNCITLILATPVLKDLDGVDTLVLVTENLFQALFMLEMFMKIFALGFAFHQHAYLRSGWNQMDFVIVCLGCLMWTPLDGGGFTAVRMVRVLRPLKAVSKVPELSALVSALLSSIPRMRDALLLLCFLLLIFAILGVQAFVGLLHQRCYHQVERNVTDYYVNTTTGARINDTSLVAITNGTRRPEVGIVNRLQNFTELYPHDDYLCDPNGRGHSCPAGSTCEIHLDIYRSQYLNFDNLATAMFLVFKLTSMDNWPENTRHLQMVAGFETVLYTIMIVVFGSFFCLNLILAILSAEYQNATEGRAPPEEEEEDVDNQAENLLAEAEEEVEAEQAQESMVFEIPEDGTTDEVEMERQAAEDREREKRRELLASPQRGSSPHNAQQPYIVSTPGDSEINSFSQSSSTPSSPTNRNANAAGNAGNMMLLSASDDTLARSPSMAQSQGPFGEGPITRLSTSQEHRSGQTSNSVSFQEGDTGSRKTSKSTKRRTTKANWKARIRVFLLTIITSSAFSHFMMFITVLNVIVLAIDHHDINPTLESVLNWINFACSVIFIIEFLIKFMGLGFKYFSDGFNRFDFLLVLISIPEMALGGGAGSGSAFSALRAFRLARVFRVVKASKTIRHLLFTVFAAAASTSYLFLLLCLFLLIFALIGINLMENAYPHGVRPNFDDLAQALLAVFIIISGENWVDTSVIGMQGGGWGNVFYFLVLYCMGNFIILNLFVAILIGSFANAAEKLREEDEEEEGGKAETVVVPLHKMDAKSIVSVLKAKKAEEDAAAAAAEEEAAAEKNVNGGMNHAADAEEADDESNGSGLSRRQTSIVEVAEQQPDSAPETNEFNAPSPVRSKKVTLVDDLELGGNGRQDTGNSESPLINKQESDVLELSLAVTPKRPANLGDLFTTFLRANDEARKKRLKTLKAKQMVMNHDADGLDDDDIRQLLHGNSFMIFSAENPVRRFCANLVIHPYFELFIIVLIAFSCVMLGFDNPSSCKDDRINQMLSVTDILLAVIFGLEALAQCIAWGVIKGEGSYLSNPWNRVDFFVVLASLAAFAYGPLKMLRSLRVFRLAARSESLRVVIMAMFHAIPSIANVVLLLLFVFIVFGILGVQLFKGSMASCNDPVIPNKTVCFGLYNTTITTRVFNSITNSIETQEMTVEAERSWDHAFFNFNHLGQALLTLFILAMNDGWSDILFQAMDSKSETEPMQPNARPYMGLYVVAFIVFGSFFMVNLFIGSLIDNFSRERDKKEGRINEEGTSLLTDAQAQWLRAWKVARKSRLDPRIPKPGNPIRKFCCYVVYSDEARMVQSQKFEIFVTVLIVLNVIFMCIQHYQQPDEVTQMLFVVNIIFATAYTIEAFIKITAMGMTYFSDNWNRFDFLLVPIAWISIFVVGGGAGAVRTLRVLRVLRLIKRAEGLQRLFNSLLFAIPQLMNTTLLLLITVFIFGVIGTDLFGEVMSKPEYPDSAFDEFFNFRNAGYSMTLLIQIATTEGWWDVMQSANIDETNSPCSRDDGNCGSWAAIPFFILFMLVANCVCINLFIFVIVDNYLEVEQLMDAKSQAIFAALETFRREWSLIDREATEVMRWESLILILRKLPRDFGFKESSKDNAELGLMKKLRFMDIVVDGDGNVRYRDCVHGLTKELFGVSREEDSAQHQVVVDEVDADHEKYFKVHHAFACRKILKRMRAKKKERELQNKVKDKLRSFIQRRRKSSGNSASTSEIASASPENVGAMDLSTSPTGGKTPRSALETDSSDGLSVPRQDSLPGQITDTFP